MTYDFLIEMAWKSAAIAGAALLLAAMLRSRAAADRGAVLKVAVALLLALPAIALFAPALEIATPGPAPAAMAAPAPAPAEAAALDPAVLPVAAPAAAPASSGGDWDDPSLLFFLLYAGGVAMVAGRLLAGLWTLRRWTRNAVEVESPQWRSALARAGGDSLGIRLLASTDASSPLSWGLRRPVILLDSDTLRSPDEADSILAHEIAHVARRDWPSLILSRLAVALFWFNPLVWRLDREVAQQAEEAADSDAAATVEPARYAQTLLDWARLSGSSALPANAIAAGEPGLSRRVKAILDGRVSRRSGSALAVAAMLGCAAFAAPVAALEFVQEAPEAPEAPLAPLAPLAPAAAPAPSAAPAPAAPTAPSAAPAPPAPPEVTIVGPDGMPSGLPAALAAAMQVGPVARAPRAPRPPRPPLVDGALIEAEVERAVAEAMRSVDIAAEVSRAAGETAAAMVAGMKHGAAGMEAGARSMEAGAERMRAEAAKLKSSRAYREEHIRRNAARGERVTHEQLLEAAEEMEEGAREMREGAREMRDAAKDMREGRHG
ncbi:MAG TPA: M56 family metallopeptidase [Allosphingosinicella sp.]|nr:M56 family metallopeptidase [Allosphingosinicella sp.]